MILVMESKIPTAQEIIALFENSNYSTAKEVLKMANSLLDQCAIIDTTKYQPPLHKDSKEFAEKALEDIRKGYINLSKPDKI